MTTTTLPQPPSLTGLYARALRGSLPIVGGRRSQTLPDTTLQIESTALEREHVVAYEHVCGFRVDDVVPWTYPHMLGFPLQMVLMTAPGFPFAAMGLVHIENTIVSHAPLRAGEPVGVRAWAQNLSQHPRGRSVDLCVEVTAEGQVAWESTSTYLHRESGGDKGEPTARSEQAPKDPAAPVTIWRIPADAGRRYAAVSGDRNPIHMHPLSARLLGMPTAIAHGMWTLARCLATLEAEVPRERAVEIDAQFKLPVRLPSKVSFDAHAHDDHWHFALRDARGVKPHLVGKLV